MNMKRIDWIELGLQILGTGIVFALLAIFTQDGVPRLVDAPGSYALALGCGLFLGFCLRWVFRRIQSNRRG